MKRIVRVDRDELTRALYNAKYGDAADSVSDEVLERELSLLVLEEVRPVKLRWRYQELLARTKRALELLEGQPHGPHVPYAAERASLLTRVTEALALEVERPTKEAMMMNIAEEVNDRSTCRRLSVGCVITDLEFTSVVSMGYNGNARGLANDCDTEQPGACGCVHAEANALLKAPYDRGPLVLFTTHSPCLACAKLILNSQVHAVYCGQAYRKDDGAVLLASAGLGVFLWNGRAFEPWHQRVRDHLLAQGETVQPLRRTVLERIAEVERDVTGLLEESDRRSTYELEQRERR